jgi:hypothetical protein
MDASLLTALHSRLRFGWMLAAVVPLAIVAGFLVGRGGSREGGIALLVLAALAEIVSPAVLYLVGFAAQRDRPAAAPPTLGHVAVALHVVALTVLGVAFVYFGLSTRPATMEDLGFLVGGMLIALVSLVPWLASVITGSVFATRSLHGTSA